MSDQDAKAPKTTALRILPRQPAPAADEAASSASSRQSELASLVRAVASFVDPQPGPSVSTLSALSTKRTGLSLKRSDDGAAGDDRSTAKVESLHEALAKKPGKATT
jgi:hypothetical protein